MSQANFKFFTQSGTEFIVVGFMATEGVSQLYNYKIKLKIAQTLAIDLDNILDETVKFVTEEQGDEYPVHGILASFDELQTAKGFVYYSAVLVPKFWALSIYKTSEVFTDDVMVSQIIVQVLENAGLTSGADFEVAFLKDGDFLERDFICQFGESDFDFISRLCENEGIYYYFDQTGDTDKIIFANDIDYATIIEPDLYFDNNVTISTAHINIFSWICRKQRLAQNVSVRDYNPNNPALDVSNTSAVDSMGLGTDYQYGGNLLSTEEATVISDIRAEALLCQKTRFYAETTVARLQAGYCFNLDGHSNTNYNNLEYVILEIHHEGHHLDGDMSAEKKKLRPSYENSLTAIESSIQFRPALTTFKPKFYGTMTAFIHSDSGKNIAEMDDEGRYRVTLPFDGSDAIMENTDLDHTPSAWIRMAQNYVDQEHGNYFPLTGGTEVLLSFINGDPDQPIIIGAVPNALELSLVTSNNMNEHIISTNGLLAFKAKAGTKKIVEVGNTVKQQDDSGNEFTFNRHDQIDSTAENASFGLKKFEDSNSALSMDDGLNHISMIYGDQYNYIEGNIYNWGADFTIGFGNDYEEIHEREDNLANEAFDITNNMNILQLTRADGSDYSEWTDGEDGLVEKTWGDKCDFHEGREFNWSSGQGLGDGGALEIFNYGNGYTENLINSSKGTSKDLTSAETKHHDKWKDDAEFTAHVGNISVEKTFGRTYTYQNGYSVDVKVGTSKSYTYGDARDYVDGDSFEEINGVSNSTVNGDSHETINGHQTSMIFGSSSEIRHGAKSEMQMGAASTMILGADSEIKLSLSNEMHVGISVGFEVAGFLKGTGGFGIDHTSARMDGSKVEMKSTGVVLGSGATKLEDVGLVLKKGAIGIKNFGLYLYG